MKETTLPGLAKNVSRIVLGTMIVGLKNYEESAKLLDDALSLGVNTLDSAWVYGGGDSERAIGQWMQERRNREQVLLISKGALCSPLPPLNDVAVLPSHTGCHG